MNARIDDLQDKYQFLNGRWAKRLFRAYGIEADEVLGKAKSAADLGEMFGADLTAAEVMWLMDKEYAQTAEDVVWRRSKLGLRLTKDQIARIDDFMQSQQ